MNKRVGLVLLGLFLAACGSAYHMQHSLPPGAPPPVAYAVAPMTQPKLLMTRGVLPEGFADPVEAERYATFSENGVMSVSEQPISTFSADVDTASYTNARSRLLKGTLPVKDAVRVEEFINYFDYGQAPPETREPPFAVSLEMAPTPWNARTQLLKIGIKGYALKPSEIPPANLVFLIDVSGSMSDPGRLGLLKESMIALADQMRPQDRLSLVVYAGRTEALLEGVPGSDKARLRAAIEGLSAGGYTAGGSAIKLAYEIAERHFIKEGVNRILMGTDGDFNVGVTDVNHLKSFVEEKRKTGVSLSVLGVGHGNLNNELMQGIANVGDGKYAYLDTAFEGKKVLVQQMAGSLATIAKDLKLQVEFNPKRVAEYRLIGYEKRILNAEDFANDKVDAGDVGAGHSVTALYEVALVGAGGERLPQRRYADQPAAAERSGEYAHLALRYKLPSGGESKLLNFPVTEKDRKAEGSPGFRLAAAVAAFGQQLRGGIFLNNFSAQDITRLVEASGGAANEAQAEFLHLVRRAEGLASRPGDAGK